MLMTETDLRLCFSMHQFGGETLEFRKIWTNVVQESGGLQSHEATILYVVTAAGVLHINPDSVMVK